MKKKENRDVKLFYHRLATKKKNSFSMFFRRKETKCVVVFIYSTFVSNVLRVFLSLSLFESVEIIRLRNRRLRVVVAILYLIVRSI